jgi:hypothetical protein
MIGTSRSQGIVEDDVDRTHDEATQRPLSD